MSVVVARYVFHVEYAGTLGNVKREAPDEFFVHETPLSEEYLLAHTVGELAALSSPIHIVDYDPEWPRRFEREANRIRAVLGDRALRIEHAGSTAVPNLSAKPTVDIVLVVSDSANETEYAVALERTGYQLRIREPSWYEHRMFKALENDVNLHVFSMGCPEIDRMLVFRDWLRSSESDCELYACSKRALAQQDWKYTQNYADAKSAVIEAIMTRAQNSAASKNG
jgi:GrpB-like predicted nucleotidyltransferase (UPF0157 family)